MDSTVLGSLKVPWSRQHQNWEDYFLLLLPHKWVGLQCHLPKGEWTQRGDYDEVDGQLCGMVAVAAVKVHLKHLMVLVGGSAEPVGIVLG